MKFTLRDLFWLIAVIGLSVGWYLDHHRDQGSGYMVVVRKIQRDLVEISAGSDDGLAVGSKVEVYRDENYVGQLTITSTLYDTSVGQMEYSLWRSKLQKGEKLKVKYDFELTPLSQIRFDSGP